MPPTRYRPRARHPALIAGFVACALGVTACEEPTGTGLGPEATAEAPEFGSAWIGRFTGPGQGLAAGSIVNVPRAVLTIARDADSVRVSECPRCLTVVLDTLFMVANVPASDPQRIVVVYEVEGVRRRLTLEKYSGAGSVSNVVLASLSVRAVGGGSLANITYVLESGP